MREENTIQENTSRINSIWIDINVKENERKIPKEPMKRFMLRKLPQMDLEEPNLSVEEMEQGKMVLSTEKSFVCSAVTTPKGKKT